MGGLKIQPVPHDIEGFTELIGFGQVDGVGYPLGIPIG